VRLRSVTCIAWVACSIAVAPSPAVAQEVEPSLNLHVERNLVVGEPGAVTATGTASSGYSVWLFVDPRGSACPSDPAAQPARAISIATSAPVGASFAVSGLYTPRRADQDSFCAYLQRSSIDPAAAAIEVRTVLEPLLPSAVAVHTVVVALRRHGFAERVIGALDAKCRRRGRTWFACHFEARFSGYELSGRGRVQRLGGELSYRLRVAAQGERFVLTERNEGELP
jgi:hypothetical protein